MIDIKRRYWVMLMVVVAIGIIVTATGFADGWTPPKADGGPLNLTVIEEAPSKPVEYYDCDGNLVISTNSIDASQRYKELDALLMKASHDAGCLDEGVYEDYLRKNPDRRVD